MNASLGTAMRLRAESLQAIQIQIGDLWSGDQSPARGQIHAHGRTLFVEPLRRSVRLAAEDIEAALPRLIGLLSELGT
mgnify:CR=1 FL=1